MTEDSTLLRRYADTGSEDAYAELVRRHLTLVYSVALRQVGGDAHLAQDVAQTVFTALARKAPALAGHPAVAGWLYRSTQYAASNAVCGERRRRSREQEAHAMQEITATTAPAADLEKLRPILDEAIGKLGETDRDAICLSFFDNRSYAEIGSQLRLSENTARMRVERALDKLHGLLARRGVTSTAAALALALPGQAATAAPAGLATTLTHSALAAAASAGAGWTILALMNTPKIAFTAAAIISAVSLGTALYLRNEAMTELAAARDARSAADLRIADLENKLATYAKAAAAADADNATLLATVETAAAQLKAPPTEKPITQESVEARFRHAQELDKAGRLEEALAEYLWCYDVGMRQITSLAGVRRTYLLTSLAELAKRLPAALDALNQRREVTQQRFLAGTRDLEAAQDLAAINHALTEDARTLELFDSLPSDDKRRSALGHSVYDQLITAQRYADAAKARPYHLASASFEAFANRPPDSDPAQAERSKKALRQTVIRQTATSIEVFAGSGDIEHAADLALRLLDFDSTPETIALLEKHTARAGQPTMISTLRAK